MMLDYTYTLAHFTDFRNICFNFSHTLPLMYQDGGHTTNDRHQDNVTGKNLYG